MKKTMSIIIGLFVLGVIAWEFKSPKNNESYFVSLNKDNKQFETIKKGSLETSNKKSESIALQSEGQFNQYLNALPTAEDFKTLTFEEVHHTPEIIKDGGAIVGRVHNEAQVDSSKRVSAMNFFKSCAEDEQVALAIRAVCLKKIYRLIPEWKLPVILTEEKISKDVTDLAMKLP